MGFYTHTINYGTGDASVPILLVTEIIDSLATLRRTTPIDYCLVRVTMSERDAALTLRGSIARHASLPFVGRVARLALSATPR
jgi:hypothetical protein